jgi:hypothetical protein
MFFPRIQRPDYLRAGRDDLDAPLSSQKAIIREGVVVLGAVNQTIRRPGSCLGSGRMRKGWGMALEVGEASQPLLPVQSGLPGEAAGMPPLLSATASPLCTAIWKNRAGS